MQSYQTFDEQVQEFARGLVNVVTALSPLALILIILGIAGANCYMEYLFQLSVFDSYALLPAILVGGLRFASGMGGISLLKTGRYIVGIFFGTVSVVLTYYTWSHIETIAASIAPDATRQAEFTLSMIVWGGLIGEAMIAAFMATTATSTPLDDPDEKTIWKPWPGDELNKVGERVPADEQRNEDAPLHQVKEEPHQQPKPDWLDLMKKKPIEGNVTSPDGAHLNGQHKDNGHPHRFHQ